MHLAVATQRAAALGVELADPHFADGASARRGAGRLAHLDQVAVGIADVAADLGRALLRRRQEVGATRAPLSVHRLYVRDADVEEAAGSIWIGRRLEGDRRL